MKSKGRGLAKCQRYTQAYVVDLSTKGGGSKILLKKNQIYKFLILFHLKIVNIIEFYLLLFFFFWNMVYLIIPICTCYMLENMKVECVMLFSFFLAFLPMHDQMKNWTVAFYINVYNINTRQNFVYRFMKVQTKQKEHHIFPILVCAVSGFNLKVRSKILTFV